MSSQPVTTFWRLAGMSYLQYINKAASTIRNSLKEPAKQKALNQERIFYKASVWDEAGKQSPKVPIDNISKAGKV